MGSSWRHTSTESPSLAEGHVESGPRNCRIRTVMRALPSVTARMRRPRGSSSAAVRATTAATGCRPVRRWPATLATACVLTSNTPRKPSACPCSWRSGGSVFDSNRLPCDRLDGKSLGAMAACLMLQRTSQVLLSSAACPSQKSPQRALPTRGSTVPVFLRHLPRPATTTKLKCAAASVSHAVDDAMGDQVTCGVRHRPN